jgi:hypothetical protein
MSFQFDDDDFEDAMSEELGSDDATTVADWGTGGIASAGKAVTQLIAPSRAGQTMDAKTQADRAAFYATPYGQSLLAKAQAGQAPTISDISNMGMALSGGTPGPSGGTASKVLEDYVINAARAASSLPSPSTPRIETPGATPAVVTPPTLPALDLSGITRALDPRLRNILGGVNAMRLQAQATSEHNTLAKEAAFRKEAIRRLSAIESRLPRSSVLSQQIRTVKVLLG